MKKLLKATVLFLCFSLLLPFAAACSRGGDEQIVVRDSLEACTLRIFLASDRGNPRDIENVERAINAELARDGKPYSIDFEFVIQSNNYLTNVESMARNGYDAAWSHIDFIGDMLQRGVIKSNIKPYLDKWGQKLYEEIPSYAFDQVTSADGSIFAIPRHAPMANDREILMVREDWMDEYAIDEMTDLETFNQYLSSAQKANGSTSGFAAHLGENSFLLRQYAPNFFFPVYSEQKRPIYIDINDPTYTVKSFYNTQNFLDMCEQANDWYTVGYLPKSSVNNADSQFNNGLTAGLIEFSVLKMTERIDSFKASNTAGRLYDFFIQETQQKYLSAAPQADDPEYSSEEANTVVDIPKVVFRGVDNMMVPLRYSEHTEEFIDFMCWTKDQKNYDLVNYGVEGENFYLTEDDPSTPDVDESGRLTFTDPVTGQVIPDNKRFLMDMPYWAINDIDYMRYSEHLSEEYISSIKNWEGTYQDGDNAGKPNYVLSPLIGFTIENTPAYLSAKAAVDAVDGIVNSMVGGSRSTQEPVSSTDTRTLYQKLLADLQAENAMQNLIDEVQRQVDEFIANKSK